MAEVHELSPREYYAQITMFKESFASTVKTLEGKRSQIAPLGGIALVGSFGNGNPQTDSDLDIQVWADSTKIELPRIDNYAYVVGDEMRKKINGRIRLDEYIAGGDFRDGQIIKALLGDQKKVFFIYRRVTPMRELMTPVLDSIDVRSEWVSI